MNPRAGGTRPDRAPQASKLALELPHLRVVVGGIAGNVDGFGDDSNRARGQGTVGNAANILIVDVQGDRTALRHHAKHVLLVQSRFDGRAILWLDQYLAIIVGKDAQFQRASLADDKIVEAARTHVSAEYHASTVTFINCHRHLIGKIGVVGIARDTVDKVVRSGVRDVIGATVETAISARAN